MKGEKLKGAEEEEMAGRHHVGRGGSVNSFQGRGTEKKEEDPKKGVLP